MKKIIVSFLFILGLSLGCKSQIKKTSSIDSLSYYVKLINKSSNAENLLNAFHYLQKKQIRDEKNASKLTQIYNLIYLSRSQYKLGFLSDSEQTAIKALQLTDGVKPTPILQVYQNTLYNHLGKLYREMGIYKSALYFYEKALEETGLAEKVIIFNNVGNIYKDLNKDSLAISYYKKAIELSSLKGYQENLARSQDNLGHILINSQPSKAFSYLQRALQLRRKLQDKEGIFTSYLHLSEYYTSIKQNLQAKQYLEKAKQIANEFNNLKYKEAALYKILKLSGSKEAETYLKIRDSLESIQNSINNKYLSLQYQINKVEKEADKLEIEKAKEEQKTIIYRAIGIIILLIAAAIYFFQKMKHRREKEAQVFLIESRIAKQVHDEVANDIYQFLVKLENNSQVNEQILNELEDIYHHSRDISHQYKAFPENENFGQLLKEMFLNYQTPILRIITKNTSTIDWAKVSALKKNTIYRVTQELMTNMKKHSQANLVLWDFNKKGKKIIITYTDNGKGTKLKKKNGLLNTESRIKAMKGNITFESNVNQGFKAKIII